MISQPRSNDILMISQPRSNDILMISQPSSNDILMISQPRSNDILMISQPRSNDILAQLQYDNDNDIQLTSIMIAHHSNLWQYTQWPTGYSPSLMIKVVATCGWWEAM